MYHFFRQFVLLSILAAAPLTAIAETRISLFDSNITIRSDGTLAVVEQLTVSFDADAPRHGIYRDLLLSYTDLSGNAHAAAYEIESVRRDGLEEPWTSSRRNGALRITIGDPDVQVNSGSVRYELRYVTDYQLAFDPQTDSLYWNVTGHAATLPIDSVNVVVGFPSGVENIEFTAMTGVPGSRDRDVRARQQAGLLEVQTLESFAPGEGLTLHVRWPAGAVTRPEGGERFRDPAGGGSLRDIARTLFGNGLGVLGAVALALLGLRRRYGSPSDDGSVRETPPENLSPAAMRWVERRVVDSRSLAAAVISLADKGRVQVVDSNKAHSAMAFRRIDLPSGPALSRGEQAVLTTLFDGRDEVRAHRGFEDEFSKALSALRDALTTEYQDAFFDKSTDVLFKGIAFTFVAVGAWFYWVPDQWQASWSFLVVAFGACAMLMWFASSVHSRTPHGEEVLRQVRGFRRYLGNGPDTGRHEVPTKTERYLASAIALEESESWANRALAGMPPPTWYSGSLFESEDFAAAVADMDQHLVRGIRLATSADRQGKDEEGKVGGVQGATGDGESGGGGGGGGAGEW